MSETNETEIQWVSVDHLLLSKCIPHSKLATAIEKYGIYVYDRFGRRIKASDDTVDIKTSVKRVLDLIASHYESCNSEHYDSESWSENNPELLFFGWPSSEQPNFEKIVIDQIPKKNSSNSNTDPEKVPVLIKHKSYLKVIKALLIRLKVEEDDKSLVQTIKGKTELFSDGLDEGTIKTILKDIPLVVEKGFS